MSNDTITAPKGFRAGGMVCGIKPSGRPDVALLVAEARCAAAAVFTRNRFCGAPIVVGRKHVADGGLQAIVVNSGNANVATGARGLKDAQRMCQRVADRFGIDPHDVLPASTGVIGAFLPMGKILPGIDRLSEQIAATAPGGSAFARAILTTDTRSKEAVRRLRLGRSQVVVAGCSKGSGMIAPNMATTLTYLTTDAAIRPAALRKLLSSAVEATLNRVTIDECTSTSDMAVVLASGLAGNRPIGAASSPAGRALTKAMLEVCDELAYQLAADGEGATRVIEVTVRRARTAGDAHAVARAVAISPLLKAAISGGDPNWGRVVQSVGVTDAQFDPQRVTIRMGGQVVFSRGRPAARVNQKALDNAMKGKCVAIAIDLAAGKASDRVRTCDLTEQYVRINADYTT
ncbi:MAG TPA: bifunctional glutamate N-acetyltransferase/amino-acid acetyltransferase ArgJ [Phycisphaerae bacterium]|nr:bifunctional glutamate N-acetyltransferase/amino-acid acetyltransferase ArgJ [Phycisphaerae bacterium]